MSWISDPPRNTFRLWTPYQIPRTFLAPATCDRLWNWKGSRYPVDCEAGPTRVFGKDLAQVRTPFPAPADCLALKNQSPALSGNIREGTLGLGEGAAGFRGGCVS